MIDSDTKVEMSPNVSPVTAKLRRSFKSNPFDSNFY